MKILILPLLLFAAMTVSAQTTEPVLTREQNASWIVEFEEQELQKQLETLQDRWVEDLNVYYKISGDAHGIKNVHEEEIKKDFKYESQCRPLYIFQNKDEAINLQPNPTPEVVTQVSHLLTVDNISHIEVSKGIRANALYGTRAQCEVIYIEVAEKAIFEKVIEALIF